MEIFERLFDSIQKYADGKNTDFLDFHQFKRKLIEQFDNLNSCSSNITDARKIQKYFEKNSHLILIQCDKEHSVAILKFEDYLQKLRDAFCTDNFKKITKNPLKSTVANFRKLCLNFKTFFPLSEQKKFEINERLKSSYGILKVKKPERPIRPIVTATGSITETVEKSLLHYLKPLESKFKYSLNSNKGFLPKFLNEVKNINWEEYSIFSLDATSLYTNVNVTKSIEILASWIFSRGRQSIFPKNKEFRSMKKTDFIEFMNSLLLEFNIFESHLGWHQQTYGLPMGGALSSFMSNVYLTNMENQILPEFLNAKDIISYSRYIDDVLVVCRKTSFEKLTKKFNEYDSNLKWKPEVMTNNTLRFLDMNFTIEKNELAVSHHLKPMNQSQIPNWCTSISTKNSKVSNFCGALHRLKNASSCDSTFQNGLELLKSRYLKCNFPENILNKKIDEILERDFKPSSYRLAQKQIHKDLPLDRKIYLTLFYTSFRVSKVASQIEKLIKEYFPEIKVFISFKTLDMSSFVLPRLKPQVTTLNVNNCCYEFRCVCGSRYIGETKLTLESRASQHRTDQKSKISNHIRYCREYNIALADYGENISNERLNSTSRPSWNIPRNFHFKHYSVLGKNYKNVFHRKTSEGIFINTENPDLNCQVFHKRTSLFGNHFASFGRASSRGIT